MSSDSQMSNEDNLETQPPKSGGAMKWILVVGVLLVILAAIGAVAMISASHHGAVSEEARSFVVGSTVVQEHLGSPIKIHSERGAPQEDKSFFFEFEITGPKGDGLAKVNMTREDEGSELILGESSLEVDGETFDLNAEDEFSLDVEGMDEE